MQGNAPNTFYFKLAGILLIPLILLVAYSFADNEITLGPLTLQKATIGSYFTEEKTGDPDVLLVDSVVAPAKSDSMTRDTTSQRILFFGDSMVEGMSKRTRVYAAENGHELLNVLWYNSSTKIWAQSDTLDHFIQEFEPTYIMICLGSNELGVRDLNRRNGYIKTILGKLGNRPYIWIGPPNWKEDTGMNDLIKNNVGDKRYFPSKRLTFERKDDGAHPTPASAAQWMDSVAVWMADSASYRIRMEYPRHNGQNGETITLYPLK